MANKQHKNAYLQKVQVQKEKDAYINKLKREVDMQRAMWVACIATHRAFGIGEKRFFEKFVPEFKKVTDYYDHCAEADIEYADIKLEQLVKEFLPNEDVHIGKTKIGNIWVSVDY